MFQLSYITQPAAKLIQAATTPLFFILFSYISLPKKRLKYFLLFLVSLFWAKLMKKADSNLFNKFESKALT